MALCYIVSYSMVFHFFFFSLPPAYVGVENTQFEGREREIDDKFFPAAISECRGGACYLNHFVPSCPSSAPAKTFACPLFGLFFIHKSRKDA